MGRGTPCTVSIAEFAPKGLNSFDGSESSSKIEENVHHDRALAAAMRSVWGTALVYFHFQQNLQIRMVDTTERRGGGLRLC